MPGYFYFSRLISSTEKYFPYKIICCLFFFVNSFCSSAQRLQTDSLKNNLPHLSDTALVNCLNILSLTYTYLQADSATLYAQKSYTLSKKINYLKGEIMSLNNEAHIAGFALHDFVLQQKISLHTIALCKTLNDKKLLADAYMNLALAFFCQSNFSSASRLCSQILEILQTDADKKRYGETIAMSGAINFETGNYESAFEYFNQSLQIFIDIHDSYNTAILLAKIGDMYRMAGDDKTALSYYFKSLKYPVANSLTWYPLADLGDTYYAMQQTDSASTAEDRYTQTIKALTIRSNYISIPKILVAEHYLALHKIDKALSILINELSVSEKDNDRNKTMRALSDIAKAYKEDKNTDRSFYYTRRLLQNAQNYQLKQYLRDGYEMMYTLYDQLHNTDSAYFYYRQFTLMKDFAAVDEFSKKIALYKAVTETEKNQQQIDLLKKEKLINQQQLQINEQQLSNDSVFKKVLTGSIIILLIMSFIIFRNIRLKQKNEAARHEIVEKEFKLQQMESDKIKSEMQQEATELELQALRAQMNPHFIFNCLNSINRFIIKKDAAEAADYLTKFAKLIRIVLQQSGKPYVPLEDELYCLQLYMDLEALRFEIPFDYEINCNDVDKAVVLIPSLLLQPFVENAIWHGLQNKNEGKGKITIAIKVNEDILHCRICDNGIGRRSTVAAKETGKESLGISLTENRLQLIDPVRKEKAGIEIHDLINDSGNNEGTCVDIKIPVKII